MTKDELLSILGDMGACPSFVKYVSEHASSKAWEIWHTCDQPHWLCWFLLTLLEGRSESEIFGEMIARHLEKLAEQSWPKSLRLRLADPWPECPADVLAGLHGRWTYIGTLWLDASNRGYEDGAKAAKQDWPLVPRWAIDLLRKVASTRLLRRWSTDLQILAEHAQAHRQRCVPEHFSQRYYESYQRGAFEALRRR